MAHVEKVWTRVFCTSQVPPSRTYETGGCQKTRKHKEMKQKTYINHSDKYINIYIRVAIVYVLRGQTTSFDKR